MKLLSTYRVFLTSWMTGIAFVFSMPTGIQAAESVDFVDTRIGVLGEGCTVIGPALPFASIHPSPDTLGGSYNGYAPGKPIRGFSQTHVSGTGWGQYGNILVSPQIGLATRPTEHDSPKAEEKAEAYQYQVRLSRYDILAQVAPTHHAAFYRFTFPASEQANIVLDAAQHIPGDIAEGMFKNMRRPVSAEIKIGEDGRSVSGHARFPGGFGGPYTVYFYAEFDHAPAAFGTWREVTNQPSEHNIKSSGTLEHVGAFFTYQTKSAETIQMKIAVSFLSEQKARELLHAEIPGWDYAAVRAAAKKTWNDALASIQIDGGSVKDRTIFYTALYHAMIMPRDRTGEFARFAPDAPMLDDHYAIWDTWRTLYPLLALIRPDVVRDTVKSFIERQRVDGAVPDTFIAGVNQFREQGGNNVDMIIAHAFAANVTGIDWEKAYSVLKYDADHRRTGAAFDNPKNVASPYRENGWIPAGIMSCSMTLEYAYNDFAAGEVAASLGKTNDANLYFARSRKWENVWNPEVESDGFKVSSCRARRMARGQNLMPKNIPVPGKIISTRPMPGLILILRRTSPDD